MSSQDCSPLFSSFADDADMLELVQEFVAGLQDRVSSINGAAHAENLVELTRLAHQLKGSGGGYGFDPITQAAAQLEAAAKAAASVAEIRQQVDELVVMCQRATASPPPA
jgi:HPt (histidine-containing phosphotransfer) domain-containing protein